MTDTKIFENPPSDVGYLLAGNEIALLEVLFYLIDKGVVDKDELAARLELDAGHIERMFNDVPQRGTGMAFPSRRLASALRETVLVDEGNNPV